MDNPLDMISSALADPEAAQKIAAFMPLVTSMLANMNQPPADATAPPEDRVAASAAVDGIAPEPAQAAPQTDAPPPQSPPAADALVGFDIERALSALKGVGGFTSPEHDHRVKLLLALRPFMQNNRRTKIDHAIKYMNAAKIFSLLGKKGFV